MTKYQIQDICSNSSSLFLPVIDVEIAKTATSFLAFQVPTRIVTFLFADVALDMAQVLGFIFVLLYYFGSIDPSSWMAFLSISLTLLRGMGVELISGKGVIGLCLFFILFESLIAVLPIGVFFVFFNQRAIAF